MDLEFLTQYHVEMCDFYGLVVMQEYMDNGGAAIHIANDIRLPQYGGVARNRLGKSALYAQACSLVFRLSDDTLDHQSFRLFDTLNVLADHPEDDLLLVLTGCISMTFLRWRSC